MEFKGKKIILIIFLAILFLFSVMPNSDGKDAKQKRLDTLAELHDGPNIGWKISTSREDNTPFNLSYPGTTNNYCFQHGTECETSDYTVIGYVEIDGDKANGKKADGTTVGQFSNNANLALGYILEAGSHQLFMSQKAFYSRGGLGIASTRQKALWAYGDTWMDAVGKNKFGLSWKVEDNTKPYDQDSTENPTYTQLKQDAIDFANKGAMPTPSISSVDGIDKEFSITQNVIGPFKINFNNDNRIHIKSIIVKDEDGNKISSGIKFCSNANGTTEINVANIGKSNFYIKNTSGKKIESMDVTIETEEIYKAKIWFLYNASSSAQRLISVIPDHYTLTDTKNVKIKVVSPSLTIYKLDSEDDTTNGLDAKFKIKTSAGSNTWLSGTKQSNYSYNSTYANATEYRLKDIYTNDDSISIINNDTYGKGLKIEGLEEGTYHVYEVDTPTGYDLQDQVGYDSTNKRADIENNERTISFTASNSTSGTNVAMVLRNRKTGSFKITKKDSVTGGVIKSKTSFKIKTPSGKYLKGSRGSYKYDDSTGGTYSTKNGVLELKGLVYGTYTIQEIDAPEGYVLNAQPTKSISITIDDDNKSSSQDFTNKPGSITIYKYDMDDSSKKGLKDAGFKIEVVGKGWLANNQAPYNYTASFEDATIYRMKNNYNDSTSITYPVENKQLGDGLKIDGLMEGTYIVYEVEAPTGYLLPHQKGYKKDIVKINNKDVVREYADIGNNQRTIPTIDNDRTIVNVAVNLSNVKKVSIQGYVWIDEPPTKESSTYNSKYDSSRELTPKGVTVRLMKKGTTPTEVGKVTTDENGKYIFDSLIKLSEFENYYVEFNYNGTKELYNKEGTKVKSEDISKFIPVALNATDSDGSKAIMQSVATKNTDLSGIAKTYDGTIESTINTYGLGKCGTLNNATLTLSNINLGIKKIPNAEYNITENIAYVKIVMKGNTYTYNYGGTGNSSKTAAPKVSWQDRGNIHGYSAEIYPSDISYNVKNSTEELKVYVVYRIDVTNLTNTNINELYMENKLQIKSLDNYYDKNRYTIEKAYDLNNSDNIKKDFDNWSNPQDVKRNGKDVKVVRYNLEKFSGGILKDETRTSYIEFRVQENAIGNMLNKISNPYGIIEDFPTEVVATGYHDYLRDDYSWDNLTNKSNIKYQQNHTTPDALKNGNAPYLIFKLGEERTIKGKVFKDSVVTNNGEALGNGKYDEGTEKGVEGVVVELVDISSNNGTEITNIMNLPTSHLYPKEKITNLNNKDLTTDARVTTDSNGNYELKGVVPGYYYLRFIYGNGEYKITDLSGNVIESGTTNSKIDNTQINAKDYKSTIVTDKTAIQALKGGTDVFWYRKLESEKASVALDKLETRKTVNEGILQSIIAGTAKLYIALENDKQGVSSDVAQNAKFDANGNEVTQDKNQLHSQVATTFNGLNFGIIEVPKQYAEIEKLITNVKLTNAQGNVLYNGNPESVASQGVVALSDLDNIQNGGSTYIRAEMVEDSLYGTNLELTYEVKVTNKSDINYYINEYYWYGDKKDGKKEVTLTPTLVKDYLDKSLTYVEEKSDKDRITEVTPNTLENITVDGKNEKVQEFNLKGWSLLYTNKNTSRKEEETSDKVKIVAQRILSSADDDMEIVSRAKIEEINRTPDPSDPDLPTKAQEVNEQLKIAPIEVHTNGLAKARFTITPPTGENRSTTIVYAIAGVVALVILSTGIVIIKKKVI